MITNSFRGDLEFLLQKVKNREKFSFSKYADGEYSVLKYTPIQNCDGWVFDPNVHFRSYNYLLDSYKYSHPDYYVGISCPCCQPMDHIQWMRDNVGTKNVTWANIFVNSNYSYFKDNFFPEFNSWESDVILFANRDGMDKKLPFKVDKYIPLDIDSWLSPKVEYILDGAANMIMGKSNNLILFSAGPLGNMLAHQLHVINPDNTYIDIGSTINPWTVGNNRRYLRQESTKTCIW